ncbi:pentapeptide repeat-containing protein [Lactococcus lactis]|uniref:pentapeptide repeat-containing protein n=1 Tax=Lactococcus lactis TaxID=1358 RepID=UPI001364B242|nr:pentapeptide repeat-containing protein [Lactococcus lactis]
MKKLKFIKNNYEKKTQDKLISSTLNGYLLLIIIFCSIVLSIFIYKSNDWLSLKLDNTMTGYIAIIGSLPTVYLWIVRERKKEVDLKNKQQEINQIKVSELNKVYVDAVNQFFDDRTFIAGAYALLALVDDWINMSREYEEKAKDYYPRVSQISSILFSEQKKNYNNDLFNSIIVELFNKIVQLEKNNNNFSFNWSKVSLKNLKLSFLDFSNSQLNGIEIVDSEFINVKMTNIYMENATLTNNNFMFEYLDHANLRGTDFSNSIFVGSNLNKTDLSSAKLIEADLSHATLTHAILNSVDLRGAKLINADLSHAILANAKLNDVDLRGALTDIVDLIEN